MRQCVFEEAVSLEFLGRSRKPGNGAMRNIMDAPLRSKVYLISSSDEPTAVDVSRPQDKLSVQKALNAAKFTGKGDGKVVFDMYGRFQLDGAQAAQRLEQQIGADGEAMGEEQSHKASVAARQQLAVELAAQRQKHARESRAKREIGAAFNHLDAEANRSKEEIAAATKVQAHVRGQAVRRHSAQSPAPLAGGKTRPSTRDPGAKVEAKRTRTAV